MPKESKSKGNTKKEEDNEVGQDEELSKVQASDFNVENYKVDPIKESPDFKNAAQYTAFPRYKYDKQEVKKGKKGDNEKADGESGKYERLIILTKPIKMVKGGFPKLDGQWRKSENDCQYFWLPLEGSDGATELLEKVLVPLDEYNTKKIMTEKNKSGFISKVNGKTNKVSAMKNLKYLACHKLSPKPKDGDDDNDASDDDDDEDDKKKSSKGGKVGERYKRIKVRLHTLYVKDADPTEERKIRTKVYVNDKSGSPKNKPENFKGMSDLRKLFEWNCEAQFALEFNKFWVMKTAADGEEVYKCSISVKCLQMYICKRPEISRSVGLGGVGIFGVVPKQLEDGSDSDSDSDDQKDSKKKNAKKGSDDESGSESGSEDDKKVKGKGAKKQESDSESEDEKPKGKGKDAKKKKDESSESEDEKPKGKDAKKKKDESSDSEEEVKPKGKGKDAKKKQESDSDSEEDSKKGKGKDAKKDSKSAKKNDSDSDDSGDESVKDSESEDEKPKKGAKGGKDTKAKGKH
jgi:hypothetical protein